MKNLCKTLQENITLEEGIKYIFLILLLIYSITVTVITKLAYIPIGATVIAIIGKIVAKSKKLKINQRKYHEIDISIIVFSGIHMCYMGILMEKQYRWITIIFLALFLINSFFISELTFKSRIPILVIYFTILISNVISAFFVNIIAFIGAVLLFISNILTGILMLLEKNKKWDKFNFGILYIPAQILLITACLI